MEKSFFAAEKSNRVPVKKAADERERKGFEMAKREKNTPKKEGRTRTTKGLGAGNANHSLRFGNALNLWLDSARINLKASSYAKYFNLINNHIQPALGRYLLSELSGSVLNAYAAEKLKSGRRNADGGLSEKTVRDIMVIIKSALRFAREESSLPTMNIKINLPRSKTKKPRVLSKDEQAALEKYLCADMDECKLGVLLCLYTGLRIGEICALKWCDIAMRDGTLTVSRAMQRTQTLDTACLSKTKVFVTEPKSERSTRTIPLPDCLMGTLKKFHPASQNAYFLTGEVGRYVEPRTYQNRFKSYIAACGVKGANFHSIRHTFATRCVEVGFEIKSLSEILGHACVKITLDRYVHSSFDLKRDNMNKLNYL